MILAHLDKLETFSYLPTAIVESLNHLKGLDLNELELGKHTVNGDKVFINVMEFETGNSADKQAEVHKEYLDIQLLIRGEERIEFGLPSEKNPISKEYDEGDDYYLVSDINAQASIELEPKMLAIFFPEEPHKPGCYISGGVKIKKAVLKLHKSLI
ncbi:N-acetylneuraminate anomerase [Photobacterium minamisatsumaniensis]|uniref:N-acetylneuraminate anomerase n=1 Tax=Photobacterium minamisatsumaniensis TaxID=2910233 RepID=UPI003D14DADA